VERVLRLRLELRPQHECNATCLDVRPRGSRYTFVTIVRESEDGHSHSGWMSQNRTPAADSFFHCELEKGLEIGVIRVSVIQASGKATVTVSVCVTAAAQGCTVRESGMDCELLLLLAQREFQRRFSNDDVICPKAEIRDRKTKKEGKEPRRLGKMGDGQKSSILCVNVMSHVTEGDQDECGQRIVLMVGRSCICRRHKESCLDVEGLHAVRENSSFRGKKAIGMECQLYIQSWPK
jgi:hypothetical protein